MNTVVAANQRNSLQQEAAQQLKPPPGSVVTTQTARGGGRRKKATGTRATGSRHSYATRAKGPVSPAKGARASVTQVSVHGALPGAVQVPHVSDVDDFSQMADSL